MKKIIGFSAMMISCSILSIGSILIINLPDTTYFFYNFSSFLLIFSTLWFVVVAILLIKELNNVN